MQHKGVLNTAIPAHVESLRVCFGPLMKYDFKVVRKLWNEHRIYKQSKKNLSGGITNMIYKLPEKFGGTEKTCV